MCFNVFGVEWGLICLFLQPIFLLKLFGFLNCFLWCANVWFVFKETTWHREPGATTSAEQPSAEIPRQQVPKEESIQQRRLLGYSFRNILFTFKSKTVTRCRNTLTLSTVVFFSVNKFCCNLLSLISHTISLCFINNKESLAT